MRAMTDTIIDLPDSKSEDKSIKSEINENKLQINQNKLDKSDLSDLKIKKPRKERNDKGHKHIFKKKENEPQNVKVNLSPHKISKREFPIWIVGIVVIFAIGIFFIKYKMPSSQRSIFQ
jgi:hypothetical protein